MINYFQEVIRRNGFKRAVLELRNKFRIPPNGFESKIVKGTETIVKIKYRNRTEEITYFIDYTIPDDKWRLTNTEWQELETELHKLSLDLGFPYYYWAPTLRVFLFFSIVQEPDEGRAELAIVVNPLTHSSIEDIFLDADIASYPITIHINPYASERDLVDFIKKKYLSEIKPTQEIFRKENIKIGKVRAKNQLIQQRNDFIYQNRHLARKNLINLVNSKFPHNSIDQGGVGKIISREKGKRQ